MRHRCVARRFTASWQPPECSGALRIAGRIRDTLTPVNAFATGNADPYLSFLVRQPIRYRRMIPNGVEALVDVRNLLAEGYRPFVSSDGSTLYFAEAARCVQGGLSFTF